MSMRERYAKHRAWGSSIWVAFTLSVHPALWFGVPAAIGFVVGLNIGGFLK